MSQYLSNLRQHTSNALREFSAHPIRYSASAVADFVKDYWDLGAAALAGFAFEDYQNAVLGNFRESVMLLGTLGAIVGGAQSTDRFVRNLFAGGASLSAFWNRGIDVPLTTDIGNYAAATFLAGSSLVMDHYRRKAENSQPTESLDAVVR